MYWILAFMTSRIMDHLRALKPYPPPRLRDGVSKNLLPLRFTVYRLSFTVPWCFSLKNLGLGGPSPAARPCAPARPPLKPANTFQKQFLFFDRFLDRFLAPLGAHLGPNLGPTWRPKTAPERPRGPPEGLLEASWTQKPPKTRPNSLRTPLRG